MKIYGKVSAIINVKTLKLFRPNLPVIGLSSYCNTIFKNLSHPKDFKIVELELLGPDEYELGRTNT